MNLRICFENNAETIICLRYFLFSCSQKSHFQSFSMTFRVKFHDFPGFSLIRTNPVIQYSVVAKKLGCQLKIKLRQLKEGLKCPLCFTDS